MEKVSVNLTTYKSYIQKLNKIKKDLDFLLLWNEANEHIHEIYEVTDTEGCALSYLNNVIDEMNSDIQS